MTRIHRLIGVVLAGLVTASLLLAIDALTELGSPGPAARGIERVQL